jgi:hypothetical protein
MHIVGITIWRNYAYRRTIPVKHWIGRDLLWKIKQQKLMLQGIIYKLTFSVSKIE